jgi:transcription antitermination factor NusG
LIRRAALEPLNPSRPLPGGYEWYVLHVSPHREYSVARAIESVPDKKWFTLVPLDKRWKMEKQEGGRRGGGRVKRVASNVPLLPRMVVVGFNEPPPWLTILEMQHVNGVLGINHVPIPLRRGEPELLKSISHVLAKAGPAHAVKPGGKALITVPGPFQGQIVEVGSVKGRKAIISAVFDRFDRKELPFVMETLLDDLEAA